jgi:transcriptional regulator with XRE-family HTH domain
MEQGVSPQQLRAARALLGWSRDRLAGAAGISPTAVANVEMGKPHRASSFAAIRSALEDAGVEFTHDGAVCVRLRGNV